MNFGDTEAPIQSALWGDVLLPPWGFVVDGRVSQPVIPSVPRGESIRTAHCLLCKRSKAPAWSRRQSCGFSTASVTRKSRGGARPTRFPERRSSCPEIRDAAHFVEIAHVGEDVTLDVAHRNGEVLTLPELTQDQRERVKAAATDMNRYTVVWDLHQRRLISASQGGKMVEKANVPCIGLATQDREANLLLGYELSSQPLHERTTKFHHLFEPSHSLCRTTRMAGRRE